MTVIKLSELALDIISSIHAAKKLFISESLMAGNGLSVEGIHKSELDTKDWYARTKKYFESMPAEKIQSIGLKQNTYCFDAILNFRITDEMMETTPTDLGKFSFSY